MIYNLMKTQFLMLWADEHMWSKVAQTIEFKWQLFEKQIEAELLLCGGSQNLHLNLSHESYWTHKGKKAQYP